MDEKTLSEIRVESDKLKDRFTMATAHLAVIPQDLMALFRAVNYIDALLAEVERLRRELDEADRIADSEMC